MDLKCLICGIDLDSIDSTRSHFRLKHGLFNGKLLVLEFCLLKCTEKLNSYKSFREHLRSSHDSLHYVPGLEVWNRNFPIDGACHRFRDRTTDSAAPSSPSSSWEWFSVDNNPRSIYQYIYYKQQHVEFCAYELQFADSTGFLLSLGKNCCRIASNACRRLRWTCSWQNTVFRVV